MEDIKKLTNDELIEGINNLSKNHENIKQEILTLHEVLNDVEQQYLVLATELKSRV